MFFFFYFMVQIILIIVSDEDLLNEQCKNKFYSEGEFFLSIYNVICGSIVKR